MKIIKFILIFNHIIKFVFSEEKIFLKYEKNAIDYPPAVFLHLTKPLDITPKANMKLLFFGQDNIPNNPRVLRT